MSNANTWGSYKDLTELGAEIISSSAMATFVSLNHLSSNIGASYALKISKPEGVQEFAFRIEDESGVLASIDMDGNLTVSDDLAAADVVKLFYVHMLHTAPLGDVSHMSRPLPLSVSTQSDFSWDDAKESTARFIADLQAHGIVK